MNHIKDIYRRFLLGDCSEQELKDLLRYFNAEENPEKLHELIEKELNGLSLKRAEKPAYIKAMVERNHRALINKVDGRKQAENTVRRFLVGLSVAAALIIAAVFSYQKLKKEPELLAQEPVTMDRDVSPGNTRAMLILSSGEAIELNGSHDAIKSDQGIISYNDGTEVLAADLQQKVTVATPRAGQYQVSLPDGTRVWLNAESSLEYPLNFSGDERLVRLIGEAYFEVKENKSKPFIVETGKQRISVIGTSFNVQAYSDEQHVATTLVKGKVAIRDCASGRTSMLSPGEQAVSISEAFATQVVNVSSYIAWKDDYFVFESMPLRDILRQLSRWYDVKVNYEEFPNELLSARIKRDKNLSSVLHAIAKTTGIKFYIKERSVMVKN